jgi:hypothetical protein
MSLKIIEPNESFVTLLLYIVLLTLLRHCLCALKSFKEMKASQRRETKADTLKATETNRRRGPGTRDKVRSKRINLEGNTHAQEINVSQLPV